MTLRELEQEGKVRVHRSSKKETLSYSTGLAIENCRFWKEIEDRQHKARLQEMDTYSYSLAHEIGNPMQVVIGEAKYINFN